MNVLPFYFPCRTSSFVQSFPIDVMLETFALMVPFDLHCFVLIKLKIITQINSVFTLKKRVVKLRNQSQITLVLIHYL